MRLGSIQSTPIRWCAARGSAARFGQNQESCRDYLCDRLREAEAAGAEIVGGEELVEKIQKESWTDFDALIATRLMRSVGRLGKVLAPWPDAEPEDGTVTTMWPRQ